MIPRTHNFPGFPDGVSGEELLDRMREQVAGYGAVLRQATAETLSATPDGFAVTVDGSDLGARRVILTTGVQDKGTAIPDVRAATLNGSVRWCPVCDGYEVIDQKIALLAHAANGPSHARFLRTYTRELTLFASPLEAVGDAAREQLARDGVELVSTPVRDVLPMPDGRVAVRQANGDERIFDTLYPLLGHEPRSELALRMGAQCDESGDLLVDGHQQTSIAGLYAAGDLVRALNQMTVGVAHAATAATAVHNALDRNPR